MHVSLLVRRSFRWRLDFWQMCAALHQAFYSSVLKLSAVLCLKQDMQTTYNVSLRRVLAATVAVDKQYVLHIVSSGVPRNFVRGGGSTNSVEDRGQGSGGGSPLVRGSGGSCNFVQEISFHIVKFS